MWKRKGLLDLLSLILIPLPLMVYPQFSWLESLVLGIARKVHDYHFIVHHCMLIFSPKSM